MTKLSMLRRPDIEIEGHYIPEKVKAAVWERDGGVCVIPGCGRADIQYDHRVRRADGGKATVRNIQLLCVSHHGEKTHQFDTPGAARSKRLYAKDRGEYRKSKNPMKSRPFQKGVKTKMPSRPFPKRVKS